MEIDKRPLTVDGVRITRHDERTTISQMGVEIRHEGKPVSGQAGAGAVYLLVDCSSSMMGDTINQAKKGALNFAKDALSRGYLTGLIRFSTHASILCDPQRDLSTLQQKLRDIRVDGSTNMTEAIELGVKMLTEKGGPRVLVIATDGMPDNPTGTLGAAKQAKIKGIDIIAVGTDDADQDFLKKLASRTGFGVKVSSDQFEMGITSAASSLLLLEGSHLDL